MLLMGLNQNDAGKPGLTVNQPIANSVLFKLSHLNIPKGGLITKLSNSNFF